MIPTPIFFSWRLPEIAISRENTHDKQMVSFLGKDITYELLEY
mgnify:CR=1 FL=1